MDAARWVHLQLGRVFPPTAIPTCDEEWVALNQEIEEDPDLRRWVKVGTKPEHATKLGDVVVQYAESLGKFHVSTLADLGRRLFLTSFHGERVRLVDGRLCCAHVRGVYRSLDLHPEDEPQ